MAYALDRAVAYLTEQLWGGMPLPAEFITYWAEQDGIRPRTLRRAKRVLRVVSEKDSWHYGWTWRLPRDHPDAFWMDP